MAFAPTVWLCPAVSCRFALKNRTFGTTCKRGSVASFDAGARLSPCFVNAHFGRARDRAGAGLRIDSVLLGHLFVAVLRVGDQFLAFRIDDEVEVFQRNLAEKIG